MRTRSNLFLILSGLILTISVAAQNSPSLGVSAHFVNFTTDKYLPPKNYQTGIAKVSAGFPLNNRFSLNPAFAFGYVKAPLTTEKTNFWDLDLSLQYALMETKFQPYITAGVGLNNFNRTTYSLVNAGLGINYWFTKWVGFNAQTAFDVSMTTKEDLPANDYWHNSLGLIFSLNPKPKDSDKDGIADEQDACPKVAGTASANGCPDADGDGIKDADDLCPQVAGGKPTFGCPDTDNDGIANAQDDCPNDAGKPELKGCPDRDNDGIADKDDKCPDDKGITQFNGCPDTDGDGITDKEDKCPTEKGTSASQGCPDKDGDGVIDNDDRCPDQPGIAQNNGCPEIKAEEVAQIETKLNLAAKQIQFESGKAVIRPVSFKEIDEIVSIMNQYNWTRFRIEGHTDNVGNAAGNQTLSDQRAAAVKDYITGKGISASRLESQGFGSTKPLASNNTTAGRAQNRRVEIHLVQ